MAKAAPDKKPVYARKAGKTRADPPPRETGNTLPAGVDPAALAALFDGEMDAGDVLQISFDEIMESSAEKKSENMITYRPREFVKTGDKISSNIVEGFRKGEAEFRMIRKSTSQPITTRVSFTYSDMDVFSSDKGFTSLDKEVHDAVVSLYAAGNKVFSPAMVYRTMTGKADAAFVPPDKIKEITASVHKCMGSVITIDASEEMNVYNGLKASYSQNLIYAKSVTLRTKGWEVSAFLIMDEPVLYRYAKIKRQLFAVPLRVLDSPPSKTNDVIVLQGYLVRVVETLRRPAASIGSEVLYASLYELMGCVEPTKQKLLRVRNTIKAILDYWVEIGYIKGWCETTRNRSKYSILLDVPANEPA